MINLDIHHSQDVQFMTPNVNFSEVYTVQLMYSDTCSFTLKVETAWIDYT